MRFRFCWDVDCPDWLLAEIATLSKMSSVKLRMVTANLAKSCYGASLTYDVVAKLAADAKLDEGGARAAVAAVRWVLESASGAAVGASALDSELQQLGLPKEHAAAVARVYGEHRAALLRRSRGASLQVGRGVRWSCQVVGAGVGGGSPSKPAVRLSLREGPDDGSSCSSSSSSVAMTPAQLHALIQELTEARRLMESLH